MSSVFSAEPPVFTRRPGQGSGTNASPAATAVTSSATSQGSSSSNNQNGYSASASSSQSADPLAVASGAMMSDAEAIAAVEARVAQEQADAERQRQEAERQREQDEQRRIQEQARQVNQQQEWEARRTEQKRIEVTAKVRRQLDDQARQVQLLVSNDMARDKNRLQLAKEQKIEGQFQALRQQKTVLEQQLAVATETRDDMTEWIAQAQAAKAQGASAQLSIDDKVVPSSALYGQMMELSAENAAITDCLYFLDRALHQGDLPCDMHLKQVRKLAKRQFLVRAHLIKINQVLLESPPPPAV
mmetsp:Transcript_7307/g.15230  ORF Transcript_7307/g.15230 Transcript_7307/m.15230 type:complete len:301 (-) Transcript_7307:42-944(-)